jgi:hypothetical protein
MHSLRQALKSFNSFDRSVTSEVITFAEYIDTCVKEER